jgi:hypothetical protein
MLRSPKPIAFLQHDYGVGINDALLHDRKWMQESIPQHWEQHESATTESRVVSMSGLIIFARFLTLFINLSLYATHETNTRLRIGA